MPTEKQRGGVIPLNDEHLKSLIATLRGMGERDCTADFNGIDHHAVMLAAAQLEYMNNSGRA